MQEIDIWEKFIEFAIEQTAIVGAFSGILIVFSTTRILKIFGIEKSEINRDFDRNWQLVWAVILCAISVSIAFVIRMAVTGQYYQFSAPPTEIVIEDMEGLAWVLTWLSFVQILAALASLILLMYWVIHNRLGTKNGTQDL